MKFSGPIKIKCFLAAILFLLFFGYIKVLCFNTELNSKMMILNTMLFLIWIGFSYVFALSVVN